MATDPALVLGARITAQLSMMLARWSTLGPATDIDDSLLARREPILSIITALTSKEQVEPWRAALEKNDPQAIVSLGVIHTFLSSACRQLLELCGQLKLSGDWWELSRHSNLAACFASACNMRTELPIALFLLATSRRALKDNQGAAEAYMQSIEAAGENPAAAPLLSAAHDNLGNILMDLGRFDEAFEHYDLAEKFETNPEVVATILANKGLALIQLGEARSASRIFEARVKLLEVQGVSGSQLGIALDGAAQALIGLGERASALKLLERARDLFAADDLGNRAINALILSEALRDAEDPIGAAEAFEQAHDLARADANQKIDADHYRRGFRAALANSLPRDHPAIGLFIEGVRLKEHDDPSGALQNWQEAINLARAANDTRLALRVKANVVALMADLGQVDSAIRVAYEVLSEARQLGLARPEIMAHGTLGSMAASGADIRDHLGVLGPQSRAAALQEMHTRVVAEFQLDPIEARFETSDTGATANELAGLAQNHCAYKLAAEYFRTAVAITKQWDMPFERINRLAGLRAVLTHLSDQKDDGKEIDAVVKEISALVESGKAPIRGQVVGRRALAAHLSKSDRPAAIRHLRTALDLTEQVRLQLPPGPNRADFDRQFRDVPYMLADLLRQEKQNEASFNALQLVQGRRMIDALAARTTAPTADAPLTAGEVRQLLARAGEDAVLVDFAVNRDGLTGYIFAGPEVHVVYVAGDPSVLGEADQGDVREREARLVSLCLNNPMLQELATAVIAAVPPRSRLMIVTDQLLNNLPLHAVPVNGRSWSDQMPIGYLPTAAVLRFPSSANLHNSVLVAGDSRGDLPGAAEECTTVSAALNASALLGQACTRAAIEDALRKAQPSIVHLAVHGRGDPRFGGRSSLLLADGKGGVEWVDFQALTAFPWTAKLVVFSGCSTGVIGRRHGSQLLSVANAALEAGARTVVASLWPVDDEYAKSFMTAFYQDLTRIRPNESADLRLLLRQARESASQHSRQSSGNVRRDGRHFGYPIGDQPPATTDPLVADALMWAPFCLFGDPVLRL